MMLTDDPTKSLSDKTEFLAVDFFRLIFALGIVALHLSPLTEVNKMLNYFLVQVLTRLGVPFFFLVSGFFVQKKLDNFEKVKRYVFRLAQLYLLYTLLYLPQIICSYIKGNGSLIRNALAFIRNFFLIGSYSQLWYFVGLIVAVLLLYLLVNKLKLSDKKIVVIALILYVLGTIGNAYIAPLRENINVPLSDFASLDKRYLLLWVYFKLFSTTRNGVFFGLPYLSFGYLIAKNRENIYQKNYLLFSIGSFVVMTGEAFLAHEMFNCKGQDMLITLLPTSIFVFLFILFIDCEISKLNVLKAKHFRQLSVLYFGLHLFINFYVDGIIKKGFGVELHNLTRFGVVIVLNFSKRLTRPRT